MVNAQTSEQGGGAVPALVLHGAECLIQAHGLHWSRGYIHKERGKPQRIPPADQTLYAGRQGVGAAAEAGRVAEIL